MTETIDYNTATTAQKLGDAILRFGLNAKLVPDGITTLTLDQLLILLENASTIIASANELVDAGRMLGNGITVDIFWERQGFYFVNVADLKEVSTEYPTLDACVRHLVLRGYTIRDVRRTRGPVAQPQPPLPTRKASDAE